MDLIKPVLRKQPNVIILHTGTNDLAVDANTISHYEEKDGTKRWQSLWLIQTEILAARNSVRICKIKRYFIIFKSKLARYIMGYSVVSKILHDVI